MFNLTQAHVDKLNNHFNGVRKVFRPKHTDIKVPFKFVTDEKTGIAKRVKTRPVLQRITCMYLGGKVGTNTGDVFAIELAAGEGHMFKAVA